MHRAAVPEVTAAAAHDWDLWSTTARLVVTEPVFLWSEARRVAAFLGFAALSATLALGTSVAFRRWPPTGTEASPGVP